MIIQDALVERIQRFADSEKKKQKLSDYYFKIRKSNTTNSIYVQLYSFIDGETLRISYRFSDHKNSDVKTKLVCKNTNFKFIERKILYMIKSMQLKRYNKCMEIINRKRGK